MKDFFKKEIWKYLVSLIVGLGIGILINIPSCSKQPETIVEYIPVYDTITITKDSIVYKTKPVNVYLIDTFYVKESGDTVKLDSIPITEYQYKDTIKTDTTSTEIMVNFHGFNAGIDSINLVHNYFEKQTTIIKEKKVGWVWFLGVSGGYGVIYNVNSNTFGHGPNLSVSCGIGIGGTIK